ncbi:MAG: energy-coupling factor ABC transporter permease [Desulfobacterales bacterium]|nr:energy-coupling factor ABC transporter permease [Desulfobacterales bacterium]
MNGLVGLLLGWVGFPRHPGGVGAAGGVLPVRRHHLPGGQHHHRWRCRRCSATSLSARFSSPQPAGGAGRRLRLRLSVRAAGGRHRRPGADVHRREIFWSVAALVLAAHLPVMVIEGIVTALCVAFLKKVQPSMLPGYTPKEVS